MRNAIWESELASRICGLLATASTLLLLPSCGPRCENHLLRAEASPDGGRIAEVFFRGCGVGAGFNSQVSIHAENRRATGPGNIFRAFYDQDSPKYVTGSPRVEAHWLGRDTLQVDYDAQATIGFAVRRFGQTGIAYRKRSDW
jgi:hypothetical protein